MRQIKPDDVIRLSRGSPSLATTLILVLLLPLMLATALTGWYSIANLERQTEARMQKDIELVARAIRLPLSHALEQGYYRTVQQALDSAFSIDRVYGVYVYDSEGSTIAASGFRQGTVDTVKAAELASRGVRRGEFDHMAGEEVFSYFVPLTDGGGRINGLLQVTRQGSDFDDYLMELRRHTLLVVLVSGLVLASILLLGYRWVVGRHLRAIEDGLERIGKGELRHRLPRRGAREFRHLSTAINQMLDAIETSQQQLTRLGERLHRTEKMAALGQLAAGVAHELGSPLSTVDGKAQRLLRRDDLPASAHQALQTLRREAARMEQIIRQLLDFGRTNPLQRRRVQADLPLRLANGHLGQGSPVSVQLNLDDQDYPQVAVDCMRLDQALSNLLRNAVQAAHGKVRACISQDDGSLCYHIDDDGPGIVPDVRPHLFEPFFTTKPVGQGTGLGLAVAHAAARDHGGEIEISESPLGGARFTLKLPIYKEDDHA
jgi:signal transduction histidine kinase